MTEFVLVVQLITDSKFARGRVTEILNPRCAGLPTLRMRKWRLREVH